jgi:hypothetical protein
MTTFGAKVRQLRLAIGLSQKRLGALVGVHRIFRGKVVNKHLTVNTSVDEIPRFVVGYLIDNYCTEDNFQEDLRQVVKRLRENFVHGAEAEKIRHQIRETRSHSIIANLEVRLQETEDKYWGTNDLGHQRELRQRLREPGPPILDREEKLYRGWQSLVHRQQRAHPDSVISEVWLRDSNAR